MVFSCFAVYVLANNTWVVPYFYRRVWPPDGHTRLKIEVITLSIGLIFALFTIYIFLCQINNIDGQQETFQKIPKTSQFIFTWRLLGEAVRVTADLQC